MNAALRASNRTRRSPRFSRCTGFRFRAPAGSAALAAILLLFGLLHGDASTSEPKSVFEKHWEWRKRYADGIDVSGEVRRHVEASGDFSFETLLSFDDEVAEALRLQRKGLKRWNEGNPAGAVDHFLRAARRLIELGARPEAIFCLFYVAEILAEREEFVNSLRWIDLAMSLDDGLPRPFLHGLLLENAAYSRWFLDRLPESILGFSRALQLWSEIDFRWGRVTSWNNLAILYQETHLPRRARRCFENALSLMDDSLPEIVRFRLHANFAEFLYELEEQEEALRHLDEAGRFQESSPEEFLLLQAGLRGVAPFAEDLLSLRTTVPSRQVERALLLARHFQEVQRYEKASHWLHKALDLSEENELPFLSRRALLDLGGWMEKTGRLEEASDLYFEVFSGEERLSVPETKFAYSRLVSPFFSGWIRSLVSLGREKEARRGIRTLGRLRMERARRFPDWIAPLPPLEDEAEMVAVAARLDFTMPTLEIGWETAAAQTAGEKDAGGGFNVLELWPEPEALLAWVTNERETRFLKIPLPEEWTHWLAPVLSPLFEGRDRLPEPPARGKLLRLYRHLFSPFEPLLDSDRVLIVPHQSLQSLPFEMLVDEDGSYLLERLVFSYHPYPVQKDEADVGSGTGEVILPKGFPEPAEFRKEELFFRLTFPEITVRHDLNRELRTDLQWLHISTHFRLDERFWLVSHFEDGQREINVLSFLQSSSLPVLLSLGVCDAGNSYLSGSPHWMGFAELMLARGVRALLLSRWQMDEFSSRIYREFYARARRGEALDVAVTEARRRFLSQSLQRGGGRVSGAHPFFWAGITYVGPPGLRLYPPPEDAPIQPDWIFLLVATVALLLVRPGRRRRGRLTPNSSAGESGAGCLPGEGSERSPHAVGESRPASCETAPTRPASDP